MAVIHRPVMVTEIMEMLDIKKNGVYVDATAGMGGHAVEILKRLGPDGGFLAIDRDREALAATRSRLEAEGFSAAGLDGAPARGIFLLHGNFSDVARLAAECGFPAVDGILMDLGMSMMQVKTPERGFSFDSDARLDMRMDTEAALTAWDVVNRTPEKELGRILLSLGEEYRFRRVARAICEARREKPIDTCRELSALAASALGRRGRTHPATKTFQALRIYVNGELDALEKALSRIPAALNPGGRLCVLSYHSLEDRIVKNFLRQKRGEKVFQTLTKKPLIASSAETSVNPSARSAKLRGGMKL